MIDGRISIITSICNSERYIGRTIESVLAQTYSNWELIITDDCSSDDGPRIVESYMAGDSRIRLLRMDTNGGPGLARNKSLSNAEGRYIAFLDSDDRWMPDKLERQLGLMKSKNCSVVYSSYYLCDENDNIKGLVRCRKKVKYWRIVCDNAIGFLTMMYDREKIGDEQLPIIRKRQDWGLNIKLLKKCGVAYGDTDPLALYCIRKNSISRDKLSLVKYNIAIYQDVLGYSKAHSIAMFCGVFMPFYVGKKILNAVKTWPVRHSLSAGTSVNHQLPSCQI